MGVGSGGEGGAGRGGGEAPGRAAPPGLVRGRARHRLALAMIGDRIVAADRDPGRVGDHRRCLLRDGGGSRDGKGETGEKEHSHGPS